MIVFPNAKINLGLRVLRKREDGYHNIESCFYPVQWNDILEIIISDKEKLSISGLDIPGNIDDNLCWKAYKEIQKGYKIEPLHIHLHKRIPMGAGVGGGSSDAAFTIKSINTLCALDMNMDEMESIASKLGSDCAFFINNKPAIATERGTQLEGIDLRLTGKKIILINPGIHVSTSLAYSGVKIQADHAKPIKEILYEPIESWRNSLLNYFEESVFTKYPQIKKLKEQLYESGALYSSMTGSGATVFGIYDSFPQELNINADYTVWRGELS